MQKFISIVLLWIASSTLLSAQDSVYMFSYFVGNGEDGLHLAYSDDGLVWKEIHEDKSYLQPQLSPDKLMRDPCIIRGGDGNFHMVWTVSWTQKSIGYASSKDLINWSPQLEIPVMAHESNTRNTWAPEITYDHAKQDYIIYWSSTIEGLFPETQSTKENAYNHRIYFTKTKDFKSFTPTRLLYDPGFNVIDANILFIKNRWYMFLKDETIEPAEKNIKIATATTIEGPYNKASQAITGNYWAEGPTVLFKDNNWIVYFDKYMQHSYGAVQSSDLKNWKDISHKIKMPHKMRHGSAFKVSKQEFEKVLNNK